MLQFREFSLNWSIVFVSYSVAISSTILIIHSKGRTELRWGSTDRVLNVVKARQKQPIWAQLKSPI